MTSLEFSLVAKTDFTHRRFSLVNSVVFKMQVFRFITALSMLLLLAWSNDSRAEYEFVTQFGSNGTALGQFASPRGVTVNHEGRIVISESSNNRIQLCSYLGVCTGFGEFGELSGQFDRPRGVAVNSTDRVFIADRGNDRIASCASTGSCTDFGGSGTTVGKLESPRGIAIDDQDQIYITDTDNNRVQICDDQGVCTAFGKFGSALGEFNSPSGIAVDGQGLIVIADRGNNRIQICTTTGNCSAFGGFGTSPGEFDLPAGVAVDSHGRIIVVDRFNDRIQVCTDEGSCTVFGGFGNGPGQFDLPYGVAVDEQDRIIVADLGNDRIQIFEESVVSSLSEMNAGLNDAWYYPVTSGQGFFINVFPELGFVSLSWFTYDTVRPAADVPANLGDPGHRWLNAIGVYSGNQSVMDITITSGGVFDSAEEELTKVDDGTIILTFTGCNSGTVEYDIPSINQQGVIPIERIANDNIALCEVLDQQAVTTQNSVEQTLGSESTLSAANTVIAAELVPLMNMNAGLNDAWYYPVTSGQGFFINVFPELGFVSLSWFTYDTVRPAADVPSNLADPGHRWLNAIGVYSGNQSVMDISITSGGVFDSAEEELTIVDDGSIILTFTDCNSGTVEYDIPSINQQGVIPIERVANDNIGLCETLDQ